jgi:hypothetical protein
LLKFLSTYLSERSSLRFAEWGGGNSCFFDAIFSEFTPEAYTVFDNNPLGLESFITKYQNTEYNINALNADVLNCDIEKTFDVVFSVGLIEHFDKINTRKAIETHFQATDKGGLVVIGFPTPTQNYLFTRRLMEALGLWKFYDERPLHPTEVEPVFEEHGIILAKKMLSKMPLTQMLYAIRKH